MKRLPSSLFDEAESASEAVQIAAERSWRNVMFSDVIWISVALHHVQ
jgi:hypothetical protein